MDSVVTALVTILAEGDASELERLLDMVGIRGSNRAADPAGHLFDRQQMPPLSCVEPVIHSSF